MTSIEKQLEALIIQYTPLLHSLIRKCITTDYHDKWDAYQDICLHLWEYIPRRFNPDQGTNLFVYFKVSMFNAVRCYRRRHRYRCQESLMYRGYFTDKLRGIFYDQDTALVEFLLHRADTTLKKKVLCMCLDGYNPSEIANSLKISRSTVYNYFLCFRNLLKEYEDVHF